MGMKILGLCCLACLLAALRPAAAGPVACEAGAAAGLEAWRPLCSQGFGLLHWPVSPCFHEAATNGTPQPCPFPLSSQSPWRMRSSTAPAAATRPARCRAAPPRAAQDACMCMRPAAARHACQAGPVCAAHGFRWQSIPRSRGARCALWFRTTNCTTVGGSLRDSLGQSALPWDGIGPAAAAGQHHCYSPDRCAFQRRPYSLPTHRCRHLARRRLPLLRRLDRVGQSHRLQLQLPRTRDSPDMECNGRVCQRPVCGGGEPRGVPHPQGRRRRLPDGMVGQRCAVQRGGAVAGATDEATAAPVLALAARKGGSRPHWAPHALRQRPARLPPSLPIAMHAARHMQASATSRLKRLVPMANGSTQSLA